MPLPDAATLTVFVTASLALLLTPGPAVLYIVARSLEQGRKAGFVSILGICVGTLGHIFAAAFGVSAILMTSALAFTVVKFLGAAYLVFLGLRKLLVADPEENGETRAPRRLRRLFAHGIVVNLLNPKAALFFFAFLPQFVDPHRGGVAAQVIALGLIFLALAASTDTLWALAAGGLGRTLRTSVRLRRAQRYVSGGVFVGLGLATAFSGAVKK